jgi:opacity protein-like surface antigen
MKSTKSVRKQPLVAAVCLLLMFCFVNYAAAQETDKWQYEATLYLWLPSIDGDLKYTLPGGGGTLPIDASEVLDSLDMTFMVAFEARYNKLSFATDFIYLDLSNSKNTVIPIGPVAVDVNAGLSIKGWTVTGIVGYDMVQTDRVRLAVIGGVRYFTLDADLDINRSLDLPSPPFSPSTKSHHFSESTDLWDGIVGVRGSIMLNEHWYLPYYADIGTGDSDLTWQLFGGIGYMFNWGDIKLGYRYLKYDQDDDKFFQNFTFDGFLLGVGFRF